MPARTARPEPCLHPSRGLVGVARRPRVLVRGPPRRAAQAPARSEARSRPASPQRSRQTTATTERLPPAHQLTGSPPRAPAPAGTGAPAHPVYPATGRTGAVDLWTPPAAHGRKQLPRLTVDVLHDGGIPLRDRPPAGPVNPHTARTSDSPIPRPKNCRNARVPPVDRTPSTPGNRAGADSPTPSSFAPTTYRRAAQRPPTRRVRSRLKPRYGNRARDQRMADASSRPPVSSGTTVDHPVVPGAPRMFQKRDSSLTAMAPLPVRFFCREALE